METSDSTTSTTQQSSHVRFVPPRSLLYTLAPSSLSPDGVLLLNDETCSAERIGRVGRVGRCTYATTSHTLMLRKSGRRLVCELNSHELSKKGTSIWVLTLLAIREAVPRARGASIYRGTMKLGALSGLGLQTSRRGCAACTSCVAATLCRQGFLHAQKLAGRGFVGGVNFEIGPRIANWR